MIKLPDIAKEFFGADGYPKNVIIHFPNGESPDIESDKIEKGSVRFTESLCSRDSIKLGLTEASTFSCTLLTENKIKGATIEVSVEVLIPGHALDEFAENERKYLILNNQNELLCRIPYGTFIIDECAKIVGVLSKREITAYSAGIYGSITNEYYKKAVLTKSNMAYKYDLLKSALACTNFTATGNFALTEIPLGELEFQYGSDVIKKKTAIDSIGISTSEFIEKKKYTLFYVDDWYIYGMYLSVSCLKILSDSVDELYRYVCNWISDGTNGLTNYEQLLTALEQQALSMNTEDIISTISEEINIGREKWISDDELLAIIQNNLADWIRPYVEITDGKLNTLTSTLEHLSGNIYPYLSNAKTGSNDCRIMACIPYAAHIYTIQQRDDVNVRCIDKPDVQFKKNIKAYKVTSEEFGKYYHSIPRIVYQYNTGSTTLYTLDSEKDKIGYSFSQLLGDYLEINGQSARIGRDNTMDFVGIMNGSSLYPREDLYPRDELYPVGTVADSITADRIVKDSCVFEEQETDTYRYITLTYDKKTTDSNGQETTKSVTLTYDTITESYHYSEDDERTDIGHKQLVSERMNSDGTIPRIFKNVKRDINYLTYDISDNLFISGIEMKETDMKSALMKVGKALKNIKYTPAEVTVIGTPFYEAGDYISVKTSSGVFSTVILTHTISGESYLSDNISSR